MGTWERVRVFGLVMLVVLQVAALATGTYTHRWIPLVLLGFALLSLLGIARTHRHANQLAATPAHEPPSS